MPDPRPSNEDTEVEFDDEVDHTCEKNHLDELDDQAKAILSTFTTIRSKIEDLSRAESDFKRFELSIELERKRLTKAIESAKGALRNARVQMAVELQKVDGVGFTKAADLIKEINRASV